MKHLSSVSRRPAHAVTAVSPLEIKLEAILEITDRMLLAQRQAAWKVPFPIGGSTGTTPTTTTTTTIPTI